MLLSFLFCVCCCLFVFLFTGVALHQSSRYAESLRCFRSALTAGADLGLNSSFLSSSSSFSSSSNAISSASTSLVRVCSSSSPATDELIWSDHNHSLHLSAEQTYCGTLLWMGLSAFLFLIASRYLLYVGDLAWTVTPCLRFCVPFACHPSSVGRTLLASNSNNYSLALPFFLQCVMFNSSRAPVLPVSSIISSASRPAPSSSSSFVSSAYSQLDLCTQFRLNALDAIVGYCQAELRAHPNDPKLHEMWAFALKVANKVSCEKPKIPFLTRSLFPVFVLSVFAHLVFFALFSVDNWFCDSRADCSSFVLSTTSSRCSKCNDRTATLGATQFSWWLCSLHSSHLACRKWRHWKCNSFVGANSEGTTSPFFFWCCLSCWNQRTGKASSSNVDWCFTNQKISTHASCGWRWWYVVIFTDPLSWSIVACHHYLCGEISTTEESFLVECDSVDTNRAKDRTRRVRTSRKFSQFAGEDKETSAGEGAQLEEQRRFIVLRRGGRRKEKEKRKRRESVLTKRSDWTFPFEANQRQNMKTKVPLHAIICLRMSVWKESEVSAAAVVFSSFESSCGCEEGNDAAHWQLHPEEHRSWDKNQARTWDRWPPWPQRGQK